MSNHYSLLPEWSPQCGVMLTWPHAENTWFPSLEEVESSFVQIAAEIAKYEKVLINCLTPEQREQIIIKLKAVGANLANVQLFIVPSNDVWARDHGPITVINDKHQLKLLDFTFNGWGNKYPSSRDNEVTRCLKSQNVFESIPLETINYVLEGGSVEVDGKGTLLTTRSCLLTETRNLSPNVELIENQLKKWFGIHRVLWLNHGYLAGDDTDGHIDTLARFTDPYTIAYVRCDDPNDEHYAALQAMESELRSFKNFENKPYQLVPLPWPTAKYGPDGHRLPATYANFLIINQAVLVPTYDDPKDALALTQLQTCFPDREIRGVPCRHVIEQYGSLHCVTMQLPLGVLT